MPSYRQYLSPGPGVPSVVRQAGLDSARAILYAVRHWGITPEFRAKAISRLQAILSDDDAKREEWIAAIKASAILDGLNVQREKNERDGDRDDARLALDTYAAALADPRYLNAISNVPPLQRLPAPAPADTGEQPST